MEQFYATGKRKSSVARVFLRRGSGKILVNGRSLNEYFSREIYVSIVKQPLLLTRSLDHFDLYVTAKGGGSTGQAGAINLGVTRALVKMNESLRSSLRTAGLLTRDSREVERKKYGMKGARARYQYSKR